MRIRPPTQSLLHCRGTTAQNSATAERRPACNGWPLLFLSEEILALVSGVLLVHDICLFGGMSRGLLMSDYYAILGVSRDAEDVVIRAAWRALAQKYHPDKFDGPADVAQKKMQEINNAYSVLADPGRRADYDRDFAEGSDGQAPDHGGFGNASHDDVGGDAVPESVKGWSWGAFLLNWIWAIGNRTWIGLLVLIPYLGFIMAILLGIKGREWAWKNRHWDSIDHFNEVQRRWSFWGVAIFVSLSIVGVLAAIALPAYKDYEDRVRGADPSSQSSVTSPVEASGENQLTVRQPTPPVVRSYQSPVEPHSEQVSDQEEFFQVVRDAVRVYPFLDHESSKADPVAIQEVIDKRDRYINEGYSPANALRRAVNEVGPMYARRYGATGSR